MATLTSRLAPRMAIAALAALLLVAMPTLQAGDPRGATYGAATDRVFWFVHTSDTHIGASGTADTDNLRWLVTTARSVINPAFTVVTGDLTDSTNGGLWPGGPYQAEWDQYKSLLASAGVTTDSYFDLPGNHDAYNDQSFSFYRANSVQGRATNQTQVSWTRSYPFGSYHFLGINTADNTGDGFSLFEPWGDRAGLDSSELTFIQSKLAEHAAANLTFVFGHHPVTPTGDSQDTYLYYGHQPFITALDTYTTSSYAYGHTHESPLTHFTGNSYTGLMTHGGIRYVNVASLGKSSAGQYNVFAVDHDGVSSVTASVNSWPVVLITAPVNKFTGSATNPYAYKVPNGEANPVRALVFDAGPVTDVSFRINGSAVWQPMTRVASNSALWSGTWNASSLASGAYTIEVRAVGTTTRSHTITVDVLRAGNQAPVAVNDQYSVAQGTTLTVGTPGVLANDSDADGNPLSAVLLSSPTHGTLAWNSNGSFTYTPTAGYSGTDSFTYAASDGTAQSTSALVSLTVTAVSPDTVTISKATYSLKTKRLTVEARSSKQPNAALTVQGIGPMTWKPKLSLYSLVATLPSAPASVTVVSSLSGTAAKDVTLTR